jgi:hypothetical protein
MYALVSTGSRGCNCTACPNRACVYRMWTRGIPDPCLTRSTRQPPSTTVGDELVRAARPHARRQAGRQRASERAEVRTDLGHTDRGPRR